MLIIVPLALQFISTTTSNVWCVLIICTTAILMVSLFFPRAGEMLKQLVHEITHLVQELTRLIIAWHTKPPREKELSAIPEGKTASQDNAKGRNRLSSQKHKGQQHFSQQQSYGPQHPHARDNTEQKQQIRKKGRAYEPELPYRTLSRNAGQRDDQSGHTSQHPDVRSEQSVQQRSKKGRGIQ